MHLAIGYKDTDYLLVQLRRRVSLEFNLSGSALFHEEWFVLGNPFKFKKKPTVSENFFIKYANDFNR